jgi:hypothetical protein
MTMLLKGTRQGRWVARDYVGRIGADFHAQRFTTM